MRALATGTAAVAALLAALAAGIWVLGAAVAWSTASAVVLVGAWFALVGLAGELATRGRRRLRALVRTAFALVTVLLLAAGAYTSLHVTTVDEPLEAGPPASRVVPPAAVDDLLAPQP